LTYTNELTILLDFDNIKSSREYSRILGKI